MTALVLAVEDLAVHFTPRAGFLGATGPPGLAQGTRTNWLFRGS